MTLFAFLNLIVVAPLLTTAFSRRHAPTPPQVVAPLPKPHLLVERRVHVRA
jgi:hypothetical protein